jgi:hypothetical protein
MKTMKIFSALSFIMILLALSSDNINAGNDKTIASIRYQVYIHGDFPTYPMTVLITDGRGRVVAQPQHYVRGKTIYTFYEAGTHAGIRIAKIVIEPQVPGGNIEVAPDIKNGIFEVNKIYSFNLYLIAPLPRVIIGMIKND